MYVLFKILNNMYTTIKGKGGMLAHLGNVEGGYEFALISKLYIDIFLYFYSNNIFIEIDRQNMITRCHYSKVLQVNNIKKFCVCSYSEMDIRYNLVLFKYFCIHLLKMSAHIKKISPFR